MQVSRVLAGLQTFTHSGSVRDGDECLKPANSEAKITAQFSQSGRTQRRMRDLIFGVALLDTRDTAAGPRVGGAS